MTVMLNREPVLWEPLVFDLTRQQLMFSVPRNEHMTLNVALLQEKVEGADITVVLGRQHQTMIWFGGNPSVPAYAELSAGEIIDNGAWEAWQEMPNSVNVVTQNLTVGSANWNSGSNSPTATCSNDSLYSNTSGSTLYVCVNSTWVNLK